MTKVPPVIPIQALRNQKQKRKPTKEDFKRLLSKPPDDIA